MVVVHVCQITSGSDANKRPFVPGEFAACIYCELLPHKTEVANFFCGFFTILHRLRFVGGFISSRSNEGRIPVLSTTPLVNVHTKRGSDSSAVGADKARKKPQFPRWLANECTLVRTAEIAASCAIGIRMVLVDESWHER